MQTTEFLSHAKYLVTKFTREHISEHIQQEDVYVVWYAKTLQNHKALLSTPLPDGMYYEVTYNGDKNEIYFDAYKKEVNIKVEVNEDGTII
jgi:hypothetical protein